jgi:hypothetical protein
MIMKMGLADPVDAVREGNNFAPRRRSHLDFALYLATHAQGVGFEILHCRLDGQSVTRHQVGCGHFVQRQQHRTGPGRRENKVITHNSCSARTSEYPGDSLGVRNLSRPL